MSKKEIKDIHMKINSATYPHEIGEVWYGNGKWELKSKENGIAFWKYIGNSMTYDGKDNPGCCHIEFDPKYLEDLPELLKKRLDTKSKLTNILSKIKTMKETIIDVELDIKTAFNDGLDKNDPKYSNAEKRRVELEKELKSDELLTKKKMILGELENELAIIECNDTKEKLQERYLFKEIDIYLATLDIEQKKTP